MAASGLRSTLNKLLSKEYFYDLSCLTCARQAVHVKGKVQYGQVKCHAKVFQQCQTEFFVITLVSADPRHFILPS